jgi:threonine/homoserine/homoserine lactone efflux protein
VDISQQIISIFILGFIGGSIPGPILASTFTEALRKGFFKSLRIIFFAAVSEIIVASLIMFLLFSINVPQGVYYGMSFIGAVVLLWLAKQIWAIRKLSDKGELFNFQKIFVLTIFNGPLWIVWSTVCVPQAYILNQQIPGGSILFLVIFEIGWFASTVLLTFIFSRFRNLLVKENVVSLVFKFFALVLIFFSLRLVVTSIMFFAK